MQMVIPPVLDLAALDPDRDGIPVRLQGDGMGTAWAVTAVVPPGRNVPALERIVHEGLATIIRQMSQWEPDSEISRYNRGEPGSWHTISPQFSIVLKAALELAEASSGAFDPAVGALTELWGFGAAGEPSIAPDSIQVDEARRYCWRDIQFDFAKRQVFQPGGLCLDLSAIAKGFAVDYLIAVLGREGIHHALVDIGGELRASGVKPNGQPWWVDIELAGWQDAQRIRIALSGWSVATTGHYLRRREAGGRNWSHSISLMTGCPVEHAVEAVSVLHPQCMQADALATAIAVMGPNDGLKFADKHRLAVRVALSESVHYSATWSRYCI